MTKKDLGVIIISPGEELLTGQTVSINAAGLVDILVTAGKENIQGENAKN